MRKLFVLILLHAFTLSLPAANLAPWTYDSVNSPVLTPSSEQATVQQVAQTLEYLVERWNAHDLNGYLAGYWNSPLLIYIVDGQQISGWQELHDSMIKGYADPRTMGTAVPGRVRIRLISPGLAFAVTNWTLNFTSSNHVVVGVDTVYLQRFESEWKIISNHTSTLEM